MDWQNILKTATLGTNRIPFEGELEEAFLLPLSQAENVEKQLLQLAGVWCVVQKAAYVPLVKNELLTTVAKEEIRPYVSGKIVRYFRDILGNRQKEVMQELLHAIKEAGLIVPPVVLPELLNAMVGGQLVVEETMPLLGERGKWLASINPAWQGLLPVKAEKWLIGNTQERMSYLKQLRKNDPDKTRILLKEVIQEESVPNLKQFLSCLEEGIDVNDDGLLHPLLNHRRKEIREVAAHLTQLIPTAESVKSIQEKLMECVFFEPQKKGVSLPTVQLPEKELRAMPRAYLKQQWELKNIGVKGIALMEMIQAVPPAFWQEYTGLEILSLIRAIEKSKWPMVFLPALAVAAIRYQSSEWANALLSRALVTHQLPEALSVKALGELSNTADTTVVDQVIQHLLESERALQFDNPGIVLMKAYKQQVDFQTAQLFFRQLRIYINNMEKSTRDFRLNRLLHDMRNFVIFFPPSILKQARAGWKFERHNQWVEEHIFSAIQLIEFRGKMLELVRSV